MVLGAIRPIVGEIRGQKVGFLKKYKRIRAGHSPVFQIRIRKGPRGPKGPKGAQGALFPHYFPYFGCPRGPKGPPYGGPPYSPTWATQKASIVSHSSFPGKLLFLKRNSPANRGSVDPFFHGEVQFLIPTTRLGQRRCPNGELGGPRGTVFLFLSKGQILDTKNPPGQCRCHSGELGEPKGPYFPSIFGALGAQVPQGAPIWGGPLCPDVGDTKNLHS